MRRTLRGCTLIHSLSRMMTYLLGALMIAYAAIFRGFGANDWSGATIMMFIAIMGMCLQYAIDRRTREEK